MIERTVLANHTHSHNNTHLSGTGFGANSMGNTFIEHNDNITPENQLYEEEDNVIQYDMEGSLWDAASVARSNVSGLTFPSEPTADLAFIRNLLNKKSTPMSVQKGLPLEKLLETDKNDIQLDTENVETSQKTSNMGSNPKYQWSNYSFAKQFTPPIKLRELHAMDASGSGQRTSKKLFGEEEDEIFETRSHASLPSEIAFDQSQTANFANKSKFSALFNRLESAGGLNNSPANFKDNLKETRCLRGFRVQQQVPCESLAVGEEQGHSVEHVDDDVSSDEEFLNEFINEMLPKASLSESGDGSFGSGEEDEEEEDDEEEEEDTNSDCDEDGEEIVKYENGDDGEDFDHEQQLQKYLMERSMYKNESEHVSTRILPKIDEVDNENDDSRLLEDESKAQTRCAANRKGEFLKEQSK